MLLGTYYSQNYAGIIYQGLFETYSLYKNDGYGPPVYGLKVGSHKIGAAAGELYAAVAITEQGKIPGKAKDNTRWYS